MTKPYRVDLSFSNFDRIFGDGPGGELTNFDEIATWLSVHDFSVQYGVEPYSGCVLGFDNEDEWFMFKIRWF